MKDYLYAEEVFAYLYDRYKKGELKTQPHNRTIQKYIDDGVFKSFKKDGDKTCVAYETLDDYIYIKSNSKWVVIVVQNLIKKRVNNGLELKDLARASCVTYSGLRNITEIDPETQSIDFKTIVKLCKYGTGFNCKLHTLVEKAKQEKDYQGRNKFIKPSRGSSKSMMRLGDVMADAFKDGVDEGITVSKSPAYEASMNAIRKLDDTLSNETTVESNKLDDTLPTTITIKRDTKEGALEVEDIYDNDVKKVWDAIYDIQEKVYYLEEENISLKAENAQLKRELSRLDDVKKDKFNIKKKLGIKSPSECFMGEE